MMKAIIVGSGSIFEYDKFLEYTKISDLLVCCDGGMKYFYECNILPDIILGDLDSAKEEHIKYFKEKNVEFRKFPTQKDYTDMELGLLYALDLNATEVFIFGGIGTRFDHTLINAHILKKALDRGVLAWLIDRQNKICLVDKHIKLFGKKDDLVSLVPFTTKVSGITTKGLFYSLENAEMEIGNSLGVSNVMLCDEFEIFVESGILFVIMSKD